MIFEISKKYPDNYGQFLHWYMQQPRPDKGEDVKQTQFDCFKMWFEGEKNYEIIVTDLDVEIKIDDQTEFSGSYASQGEMLFGVVDKCFELLT